MIAAVVFLSVASKNDHVDGGFPDPHNFHSARSENTSATSKCDASQHQPGPVHVDIRERNEC